MPLQFTKMHGLGNDYVYISVFDQHVADAPVLARRISDRHRGIGGDGLVLLAPPTAEGAHVRMEIYNADGSRAEMCGNGIRCLAKLAFERGIAPQNPLRVETDRGVLEIELTVEADGRVTQARVDMGPPILEPKQIPVRLEGHRAVAKPLALGNVRLSMTCVSMGNPHAVFFVPSLAGVPLAQWGPQIENHELFPERVNAHFVEAVWPNRVKMATWERGSGITQACGTGAAAVCVAGVLNGITQRCITAELPGGILELEWGADDESVFMTGGADEVFTGSWPN